MYSGYSAPLAALAGVLACFPVAALRKSTRVSVTLPNIIEAMVEGAKNALAVALACACAGIMIGVVTLSGLGIVFTQWVVGLAQDTLFVALIMTMLAAIVLGTGLPTTPSYILLTALLIPAIMKLGVIEPAAHMFAFYYSILSAITPPVALAVFAAAGLAKADMWTSGWAAMKIGAAGFIIPFMFVYQPALLMIGTWPEIIWAFSTSCVGIALFAGRAARLFRHRRFLLAARRADRRRHLPGIPGRVDRPHGSRAGGHRHRHPGDGAARRNPTCQAIGMN